MRTTHTAVEQDGAVALNTPTRTKHVLENVQNLNYLHLLYFWTVARDGSIAKACDRLQISQPTISMQIRKLEKSLGHRLFDRAGRGLELTEVGRTVYEYAEDMFTLGRELLGALRGMPGKRSGKLCIGIPAFLPTLITHRLLAPVFHLPENIQLVCHEDDLNGLVAGLARHKFDAIITDSPIHSASGVRCFSHLLEDSEIAFCAVPSLVKELRDSWPDSLEGVSILLPTVSTEMRRTLDRWFDHLPFSPNIVAEFDDTSLMKKFGAAGKGIFPIPLAILSEVKKQLGVELIARLPSLRVKYYVVTTERKLKHPGTIEIVRIAKMGLLNS